MEKGWTTQLRVNGCLVSLREYSKPVDVADLEVIIDSDIGRGIIVGKEAEVVPRMK